MLFITELMRKIFSDRREKIFQGKETRFGIIGGIVPYKGHEELIRACGQLKRKGISDFELKIVGKGKESFQRYLKRLSEEENLQDNIFLPGQVIVSRRCWKR